MTDTPERHGEAWSVEEQRRLYEGFVAGRSIPECMETHGRTRGGIRSCLRRLGLIDEDNNIVKPPPAFQASASAQKRQQKKEAIRKSAPAPAIDKSQPEMNAPFREALRLMEETSQNLFITGKAGTGKSTLLSYFCRTTDKQPVVLAPTGVAALNVKGQTIHRFFNFYVDVTPEKIRNKKKVRNAKLFKKLKTIIIDEISMVRADLLDCIDVFLRMHGPSHMQPFGGVQMIFVGDLYQLPPVVTSQEQELFSSHYETPYFFSAQVMQEAAMERVELTKVYRQKEQDFVDLLNKIRNNSAREHDLAQLNSRMLGKDVAHDDDLAITLTTTNAVADALNDARLAALEGTPRQSIAEIQGDFGREYYPTAPELSYKSGAQVMLLNNDSEKRWVNGSLGVITGLKKDVDGKDYVQIWLQDSHATVDVYPHAWEVYRFGLENGQVTSEPAGTFRQYPFRLAWAITIHKSQGKTFPRVVIDVGRGAFAAGQTYVALSRCTSFAGLALKTPIRASDIRTDPRIVTFMTGLDADMEEATEHHAENKIAFIRQAIHDKALLDITYLKADDTQTECEVIPLRVGPASYQGRAYHGMKAVLPEGGEERMFQLDRILKMRRAESA